MSRTGTVARLYNHEEEPLLTMNPADMQRRGLRTGDIARVRSRRGELAVRVQGTQDMRPAQAYLPMHWGSRFMHGGGINTVTCADFDPLSKQPELKHVAVQVDKLDYRWELFAVRSGDALGYLEAVRPLLQKFPYATCGLYGRERPLLVFRAAAPAPVDAGLIARLDNALALTDLSLALDYLDARRGVAKRVLVHNGTVIGVRLTGETAARDWLKELCAQGASAEHLRTWVLAPVSNPPASAAHRGRVVCNCLDVAERDIRKHVDNGATIEQLQRELGCGTSCGSCLPEIKRLLAEHSAAAAA
jgi:assimilatory nitrate reductase catalytic subunit